MKTQHVLTDEEYQELKEKADNYDKLVAGGVEHWQFYDDAMKEWWERDE